MAPWVWRNYLVFGEPQFSSGAGKCLLDFNASILIAAREGCSRRQAEAMLRHAASGRLVGRPEAQFADSRAKTDLALRLVGANPGLAAALFAKCFAKTLFGPSRAFAGELFGPSSVALPLSTASGVLAMLLAGGGLWAMLRRPDDRPLGALVALSLAYAVVTGFVQGYSRFRIPYVPLLMLAAGTGTQALWTAATAVRAQPSRASAGQ
jgi:hypothetical protein